MQAQLEALGWWAIDFQLLAALLLGAVCAAVVCLRQPAHRVALAWAASVGLLLLALLTSLPGWPRANWLPAHMTADSTAVGNTAVDNPTDDTRAQDRLEFANAAGPSARRDAADPAEMWLRWPAEFSPIGQADDGLDKSLVAPAPTVPDETEPPAAMPRVNWPLAAGALIATSAALSCAWLLLGIVQAARLRRRGRPAPAALVELLDRLIGDRVIVDRVIVDRVIVGARRRPLLLASGDVNQPLAMGLARPAIVLPDEFVSSGPAYRVAAALAHEWAHIHHGDLWLLALSRLLLPLLAVQPLFWWLRRVVRDAQEELADAAAASRGDRFEYAEVLLSWARSSPERVPRGMAGSLALWERPSQLKRRVLRLLQGGLVELRCSRRRRLTIAVATLAAVALLSLQSLRPAAVAQQALAAEETGAQSPSTDDDAPGETIDKAPAERATQALEEEPPADGAKTVAPAAAASEEVTVRGFVQDPDGKPLAGAKLYLWYPNRNNLGPQLLGASGAEGQFEFRVDKSKLDTSTMPDPWPMARITATAEGFGLEWVDAAKPDDDGNQTIHLVHDVPMYGRVLTLEGKPVAGAKVRLRMIGIPERNLDAFIEAVRVGTGATNSHFQRMGIKLPEFPEVVLTDDDGRFTLRGLGAERVVEAAVEAPGIEWAIIRIMTRECEPVVRASGAGMSFQPNRAYGATFEYLASPARPVAGTVRDHETGAPIAGVTVRGTFPFHFVRSDENGRFELPGEPKIKQHVITVAPGDLPYFGAGLQFDDTPGFEPLTADVQLYRGIEARGRVTAQPSGAPNEAHVDYYPLLPNRHKAKLGPSPRGNYGYSSAECGADGAYTLPVLPGPGVLAFRAGPPTGPDYYRLYASALITPRDVEEFFHESADQFYRNGMEPDEKSFLVNQHMYNRLVLINPTEDTRELTQDATIEVGRTVAGRIEGPEGAPLAGAQVRGLDNSLSKPERLDTPEFTILALNPRRRRVLVFEHRERNLGSRLVMSGNEPGPLVVRLQACGALVGRLLDANGEPWAESVLSVCVQRVNPPEFAVRTDGAGRFRIEGIVPGVEYDVLRERKPGQPSLAAIAVSISAAGETKDLGDLAIKSPTAPPGNGQLKPGTEQPSQPKLKDESQTKPPAKTGERDAPAKDANGTVIIRGRVLDLEGRPIAGARVRVTAMRVAQDGGTLDAWLEAVLAAKDSDDFRDAIRRLKVAPDAKEHIQRSQAIVSGNDGRIEIDPGGAERVLDLIIDGDRIESTSCQVTTRQMTSIHVPGRASGTEFDVVNPTDGVTVYGAEFEHVPAPATVLEGTVRDRTTKEPLAGVAIHADRCTALDVFGRFTTTTDEQGHYRLIGIPARALTSRIEALPGADQPYLGALLEAPLVDAGDVVALDFELSRGVWVEGRVTDRETGEGVGAQIWYFVRRDNPFRHQGSRQLPTDAFRRETALDGTFRMVVFPGHGLIGARARSDRYAFGIGADRIAGVKHREFYPTDPVEFHDGMVNVVAEIEPDDGAVSIRCDLVVERGRQRHGTVLGPDGTPLDGARWVWGWQEISVPPAPDLERSRFTAEGLVPGRPRTLVLQHTARKLIGTIKTSGDGDAPLEVRLQPWSSVHGRLVDSDGEPRTDVQIVSRGPISRHVDVGRDGRFEIDELVPGVTHRLSVLVGRVRMTGDIATELLLEPGESRELGDVEANRQPRPGKPSPAPKKPDDSKE